MLLFLGLKWGKGGKIVGEKLKRVVFRLGWVMFGVRKVEEWIWLEVWEIEDSIKLEKRKVWD